jgi:hypothetical protein
MRLLDFHNFEVYGLYSDDNIMEYELTGHALSIVDFVGKFKGKTHVVKPILKLDDNKNVQEIGDCSGMDNRLRHPPPPASQYSGPPPLYLLAR